MTEATEPTTCHGCIHLTYDAPITPQEAALGGLYTCGRFGMSMPASETPRPLHTFRATTDDGDTIAATCKEPK